MLPRFKIRFLIFAMLLGLLFSSCTPYPKPAEFSSTATLILLPTEPLILETPTLLPTASLMPYPAFETISSSHCDLEGMFWKCTDEFLGIEFKAPSYWGTIEKAYFGRGGCGGYGYSYDFEGENQVYTLGQSFDYCLGTEGLLFTGFRERQKGGAIIDVDGCRLFSDAVYCEIISSNVVMAVFFPESESLCNPYADTIWTPIVRIAVSLPMERKIQGLLFTTYFLSIKLEDQLFEPLGGVNFNQAVCDDINALHRFDVLTHDIAQAVIDGRADDETKYKLGLVREFAESIRVNSP